MAIRRAVIDGTNAMHAMPEQAGLGKAALAGLVAREAVQQFPGATIDLVFDGTPFVVPGCPPTVRLHFSGVQAADVLVLAILKKAGATHGTMVVTRDRTLAAGARKAGATVTEGFGRPVASTAQGERERKPEQDENWQETLMKLRFDL